MAIDICGILGVPLDGFKSRYFVTSWCLPPDILAIIRLSLSIYCFTAIAFSFNWFADHQVIFHLQDLDTAPITFPVGNEGIRQSFSYFTYETFWGLAFYFLFASIHTFVYARRKYTWLDNWPRYLQTMHSVYYSTIVCFPLLVTTVYWGTMWTRSWWTNDRFLQWNMITMHAMNSVLAAFEIVFTETRPFPITHLSVLLLCMTLYLGVAYITKATEGIYIYLWLDPKNGVAKLFLHIVGYAVLIIGYFFLVQFAIRLRCQRVEGRRWQLHSQPRSLPIRKSWVSSRNASSSRLRPSTQESIYWTYDRYEMEMLNEEREKQSRSSLSGIREPELAWTVSKSGRSSQATTVLPGSPLSPLPHEDKAGQSYDYGWPLVTPPMPQSPRGGNDVRSERRSVNWLWEDSYVGANSCH